MKESQSRSWKKVLVFFLAIAMTFTTVDMSFVSVYADDDSQKAAHEQQVDENSSAAEETPVAEDADESAAPEEAVEEETEASKETTTEETKAAEETAAPEEAETAEPEQTEEETEAEDVSMPKFQQSQTVDGVVITVTAKAGVFPEGARLSAKGVSSKQEKQAAKLVDKVRDADTEIASSYTFDIKVLDKDGNEIQPADGKEVYVSFKTSEIKDKDLNTEIYHIADSGSKAELLTSAEKGDLATAKVNGFSIYVITFAADGETVTNPAMVTYNFYESAADVTSGTVFHSQKVKAGDTLYMPSTPDVPKNAHFDGWYINGDSSDADNKLFTNGENMTVTTLPSGDVTVVAVSVQNHYATFYDEDGTTIVTRKLISDGKVTIGGEGGVTVQSRNAHNRFIGWKEKGDADTEVYTVDELTGLDEDIELEPVFETGIWINFKKNCKDKNIKYIPSLFVPAGSTAQEALDTANRQIPDPDRNGYNFVYWSTNSNADELVGGGESAPYSDAFDWNSNSLGNDNINLYARYSEGTANYSIIVWKQNVDGTGYDYYDYSRKISASSVVSAATGSTVNLASNDVRLGLIDNANTKADFTGFYLDRYDDNVQVEGDNSSVINIYYNRKTVTYYFMDNRNRSNIPSSYSPAVFLSEFESNNYSNYKMTYTGLYGAGLPGAWPTYGITGGSPGSSGNKAQWKNFVTGGTDTYTGNNLGTKTLVPNSNARNFASDTDKEMLVYLFANGNVSSSYKPYYMLVEGAGGNPTVTVDGKSFGIGNGDGIETSCSSSQKVTLGEKFYGYHLYKYRVDNGSWQTATAGSSTSSYVNNYLYVVYAKNESSIIFVDSFDATDTASPTQTHKYLDDISSVNSLEPTISHDGYEFSGWYLDKKCTQKYNATTMPGNSIELFAGWKEAHHYVQVDLNGGSIRENSELERAKTINGKRTFHVAGLETVIEDTLVDGIVPPEGYILVGWKNGKGKSWNFDDPVTKGDCDSVVPVPQEDQAGYGAEELDSMTIKPIWHLSGTIHIEYNPLSGTITHADDNIYQFDEDAEAIVYGIAQAPASQRFVGWKDSKGNVYETGDMISLTKDIMDIGNDGNATVTLTAVYEGSKPVVTITYDANYSGANPATKTSDDYESNDVVTLEGQDCFTREGYTLDGWATSANGDKVYDFGQKVGVDEIDADTANVLYAHWVEHIHNWTYEVSDDGKTITATCDAAGHTEADGSPSVTLVAPTATTYSGSAVSASLNGASAFNTATGENAAIVYYRADASGNPTGEALSSAPSNVGKYVATVTLSDNTQAKLPFEITKNETNGFTGGAAAAPTISEWEYDGKAVTDNSHKPTGPSGNTFGDVTYVYEKKGTDGNWTEVSADNVKNAGDYRVKAVVSGTDNYNGIESAYTEFSVSKAGSTLTEPTAAEDLTYDGTPKTLVTGGSATNGTVMYRLGEEGTWTDTPPTATDAGDYKVYYYVKGDDNHNDIGSEANPSGPIDVTISKKAIDANDTNLSVSVADAGAYTGSALEPAVTITYDGKTLIQGTDFTVEYENNINAGDTAKAKITFKGNYSGSAEKTFSISKANLNVSVTQGDVTYGTAVNPVVSGQPASGTTVTYEYKVEGAEDSTYTTTAPTDAGSYVVRATVSGSNYNEAKVTDSFKIEAKAIDSDDISVELTKSSEEYDGNTKTVTATVTVPDPSDPTKTITLVEGTDYDITVSPQPVKDVGNYTATITLKGNYSGSTTATYTITEATAEITEDPQASTGLTYNGGDQPLLSAPAAGTGGTVMYALSEDGPWSTEIPTGKDAETYNVYYKVEGDSNHNDSAVAGPVEVTISPKDITVTADNKTSAYKAEIVALTFTVPEGALVGGDTKDSLKITASTTATNTSPADTYPITLTKGTGSNKNYNVTLENGTYTITKLNATITVSNGDATYDGKPHSITVSVQGNTLGELIGQIFGHDPDRAEATVYYSKTEALTADNYKTAGRPDNPTFTKAGDHTVYYYIELVNHETTDAVTGSSTVNITKAPLTVKANNKTITYGDVPANDGVSYSGFVNGESESVLTGTASYSYNYAQYDNVGEYAITPSGLSSGNYEITFENGKLTVEPKPVTFTWDEDTFVYDGNPKTVTATAATVNNDVLTLAYQDNVKTDKGDYTAKVTAISGDKSNNYVLEANESTASHTWSITQATNSITALTIDNKDSWTYGDDAHNITVTASFGSDAATYEYFVKNGDEWTSVGSTQPTAAGDYKVVATIAATDDYAGATAEETFTIKKAALTTADLTDDNKPKAAEDLTYTGSDQALVTAPETANVPEGYTIEYKQADGTWGTAIPEKTDANESGYTVEYRYKGDENHEDLEDANFKLTVPIAKADISPAPEASIEGWTYGDSANSPSVSSNPENADVTYEYFKKNSDGTYTSIGSTAPTEQGNYAVKATIAESSNYNGATTEYEDFTIAKKTVDTGILGNAEVSLTETEYTYDGNDKTPGAEVKVGDDTLAENTDYTIKYYKAADVNEDGTIKEDAEPVTPNDFGDYKAVIEFIGNYTGDPVVKPFTIKKADITPSVSSEGWTYGEEAKTPTVTGNTGNGEVTYSYLKKNDAGDFVEIEGTPSEAGEYKVKASIAETNNYNAAEATSSPFTISKKDIDANDITVTFPTGNDAPVYDGTEQKPVPTVTVPDPTDPTKTVTLIEGEDFEVVYPEDTTSEGEKSAKIVLIGNYSGEKDNQKYTVKKRPLTVTIQDQTITYGSSIDQTKYNAGEPAEGQTVTVVLAQSTENATNGTPGQITATVTIKEGDTDVTDNYDITAVPASLTIDRASLYPSQLTDEQKPSNVEGELTYTAQPQNLVTPPASASVPEGYKLQYKLAEDGDDKWSDSVPQGTDAGTYNVVYKYVPIDENHAEVTNDSFKLEATIAPADLSGDNVVIEVIGDPFTFNDSDQEPQVKVYLGGVELPAADYTVSYENNKKAGTATVTVTAKENGNCINANSTTFSINAKPLAQDDVTVTFPSGDEAPVYDGTEKEPKPTVVVVGKTLVEGEDYDVIYPEDTVNAGEKTAKIVFKGDYINEVDSETGEPKPITGTYTVKKAPLTITAKKQTVTTDNKFDDSLDQVTTGENQLQNGDQLTDITFTCDPEADTDPLPGQAQTGTITLSGAKIMNGDKDVTNNYEIEYPEGLFKIKGSQEAPSDEDVKDLVEDQTTNSITINTEPGYEYILTTSPEAPADEDWSSLAGDDVKGYYEETGNQPGTHTFDGLDKGTKYYVHARKVATDDLNPSPATTVPTSTRPNAPTNSEECVDVGYVDETLTAKEGFEIFDPYANDGEGAWVTEIKDFEPGQTYAVRIAEKDGIAPSDSVYYTAPSRPDAPGTVDETDKTDTSITIKNTDETQEYLVLPAKADGSDYTEAEIEALFKDGKGTDGTGDDITFTKDSNGEDIQPETGYVIYNRTKAKEGEDPALASKPAGPTAVTTKAATSELSDEEKEALKDDTWNDDTAEPNSITVNGTDGYEYLVVPKGTAAEDIDWSKADKCPDDFTDGVKVYTKDSNGNDIAENTDYEILVRKAETDDSMPSEPETIDAYTTRPAPEEGEGYKADYPNELIEVEDGYEIHVVSPEGTEPSEWTEGELGEDGKNYVPLIPGATYEIRKKADSPNEGDHESEPATFTTTERPETPAPVSEDEISKKDTSITVNPTDEAQEYIVLPAKADGSPYTEEELAEAWKNAKDGNGDALTFNKDANGDPIEEKTEYVVINRIKAKENAPHSGSAISDPVTTKESQTAPTEDELKDLIDDQKATSITINTQPGYEYVISTSPEPPTDDDWSAADTDGYYKENGSEPGTHTFDGLDPGTKYYVHARKAETDEPEPGQAASPARTVETETRNSTPDPVSEDDIKAKTGKDDEGNDTSSITIDPTEKGNEYIVVPKGTDPSDYDWTKGQKSEDGEAITFDGLTPGKDYEVVTRKAATDTGKESEPAAPTPVTTPKADRDAPAKAPTIKSKTDTSVTTAPTVAGQEYIIVKKGEKPDWSKAKKSKDGEAIKFTGLDPVTEYEVLTRIPGDSEHNPSPAKGTKVKTKKADQKAPAKAPKIKEKTDKSITIDPTVKGQQYIVVKKGEEPNWNKAKTSKNGEAITFSGLEPGTEYVVLTRLPGTKTANPSPATGTTVTTNKAKSDKPAASTDTEKSGSGNNGGTSTRTGNTGNGGNNGGNAVLNTNPAPLTVDDNTPDIAEDNEPIVSAPTDLDDSTVPLDEDKDLGWALLNLILAVLTVAAAITTLLSRRREGAKSKATKAGNAVLGAIAAVVLLVTEHFSEPMQMVDKYTAIMAVIFVASAAILAINKIKGKAVE